MDADALCLEFEDASRALTRLKERLQEMEAACPNLLKKPIAQMGASDVMGVSHDVLKLLGKL